MIMEDTIENFVFYFIVVPVCVGIFGVWFYAVSRIILWIISGFTQYCPIIEIFIAIIISTIALELILGNPISNKISNRLNKKSMDETIPNENKNTKKLINKQIKPINKQIIKKLFDKLDDTEINMLIKVFNIKSVNKDEIFKLLSNYYSDDEFYQILLNIQNNNDNNSFIKFISDKIPKKIIWGVLIRDNYTCQICGKYLLNVKDEFPEPTQKQLMENLTSDEYEKYNDYSNSIPKQEKWLALNKFCSNEKIIKHGRRLYYLNNNLYALKKKALNISDKQEDYGNLDDVNHVDYINNILIDKDNIITVCSKCKNRD